MTYQIDQQSGLHIILSLKNIVNQDEFGFLWSYENSPTVFLAAYFLTLE